MLAGRIKIVRLCVATLLVLLIAFLLGQGCAPAQETQTQPTPTETAKQEAITLRFNYGMIYAPNSAGLIGKWWADEVEKRSAGRVRFEHFYGSTMSSGTETIDFVQRGLSDLGAIVIGFFPKQLYLHGGPGSFSAPFGPEDPKAYLNIWRELRKQVPELDQEVEAFNAKYLFVMTLGPYVFEARMPIQKVEDLKGKKIIFTGEYPGVMLAAAGAVQMNLPVTERYTALQTGLADASALDLPTSYPSKLYEVAPQLTINHVGEAAGVLFAINRDTWNRLPKDIQQIMLDVAPQAEDWLLEKKMSLHEQYLKEITTKHGVTQYDFPLEERVKWANMSPDIPALWIEKGQGLGLAAEKVMKTYLSLSREAGYAWPREWLKGQY